jgi:hypothetical protein
MLNRTAATALCACPSLLRRICSRPINPIGGPPRSTGGFSQEIRGCNRPMTLNPLDMLGGMTESAGSQAEPTAATEPPSRWDRRWGEHRPGGIFRLAALVVILAGIVFIFAVVFWTGMMMCPWRWPRKTSRRTSVRADRKRSVDDLYPDDLCCPEPACPSVVRT